MNQLMPKQNPLCLFTLNINMFIQSIITSEIHYHVDSIRANIWLKEDVLESANEKRVSIEFNTAHISTYQEEIRNNLKLSDILSMLSRLFLVYFFIDKLI